MSPLSHISHPKLVYYLLSIPVLVSIKCLLISLWSNYIPFLYISFANFPAWNVELCAAWICWQARLGSVVILSENVHTWIWKICGYNRGPRLYPLFMHFLCPLIKLSFIFLKKREVLIGMNSPPLRELKRWFFAFDCWLQNGDVDWKMFNCGYSTGGCDGWLYQPRGVFECDLSIIRVNHGMSLPSHAYHFPFLLFIMDSCGNVHSLYLFCFLKCSSACSLSLWL